MVAQLREVDARIAAPLLKMAKAAKTMAETSKRLTKEVEVCATDTPNPNSGAASVDTKMLEKGLSNDELKKGARAAKTKRIPTLIK